MKKRRLLAILLVIATTITFVQCSRDIANEENYDEQVEIEEVKPVDKEEFFEKVNGTLKEYAEIVEKNSIGGYLIEERGNNEDEDDYGIYFDTYIEVMSSEKSIEDGSVYYLLTENEEGKLVQTDFTYVCSAVLRTPEFELDNYPVLKAHLEKIKEIDPKLDLDEIEKVVNETDEDRESHIFFNTDKDENINSKLEKGTLMLSISYNENNEKEVCVDYTISNGGIVE